TGEGVEVNGRFATITSAGTYRLTGTLTDGQIIVDTEDEETVHLIFDGINISNESSAPIYIANAEETVIMLAEGSENVVTDGAAYVFPDPEEDEPNAAIFSKDDLTIFGEGSLTVEAHYNDGITSKDGLIITSGTINVSAVDDGIRGKDYLIIKDGNITVNAQGDGLKSDEDEDAAKGYISIEGGTIQITSGGDAIQAETDVLITDGEFTIISGGGSNGVLDADASAKGIKAGVAVNIDGGTFTIQSADDGVHSNGTMTINGGSFTIASGDDGMHADASLEINDGTIDIQQSYEGLEANDVIINGGTIDIISSDDGINAAGGNDNSSINAPNGGGRDNFTGSQSTITINGGTITIAAGGSGNGDGLDANGTITISGGDIVIKEPASYRDYSNIDYDTTISFTGGSVRILDANGTYTEVTSDNIGMMGGFGGPGGGRPGGGGAPPPRP
ncbi:MAG: carbohydrate-binding domain-containing protein, partial [Anaerolineales bacterium]|nr:carbohydrate-binding domain-containing protein [Anaerolineales bacterium]